MKFSELKTNLCKPSPYTSTNKKVAILRLWNTYSFIEYPREKLEKVLNEFQDKFIVFEAGLEEPTASDKFLFQVLLSMAGKGPNK